MKFYITISAILLSLVLINNSYAIVISEILPGPDASKNQEEWIELFNDQDKDIDISDWKIKDVIGKTKTYVFPKGTTISAKNFLVLYKKQTKISLNNDGDGVQLFDNQNNLRDEILYESKAPSGKSLNNINGKLIWSEDISPGLKNKVIIPIVNTIISTTNQNNQYIQASSSQNLYPADEREINRNRLYIIAFSIAIFSSAIILLLKRSLYKDV